MAIPDFQTLMLPVLSRLAMEQASTTGLIATMADHFGLADAERAELLPSGRQPVIANRVHWAVSYLGRAGLVDRVARGVYRASDRGRAVLAQPPERITIAFLRQFPEFRSLRPHDSYPNDAGNAAGTTVPEAGEAVGVADSERTPEERIGDAEAIIRADLRERLLQRVRAAEPAFFEQVVIDLLVSMGYGTSKDAGEVRGKAGDGGIDGVIREDRLGLDLIYVQAKRYGADNPVGPDKIREFSGALDFAGARKGVFITTSRFTSEAARFAAQLQMKRIVLIDGDALTDLMIQHGVGVRPKGEPIVINEIDLNYFEPDEAT
jgi:restriction system protein